MPFILLYLFNPQPFFPLVWNGSGPLPPGNSYSQPSSLTYSLPQYLSRLRAFLPKTLLCSRFHTPFSPQYGSRSSRTCSRPESMPSRPVREHHKPPRQRCPLPPSPAACTPPFTLRVISGGPAPLETVPGAVSFHLLDSSGSRRPRSPGPQHLRPHLLLGPADPLQPKPRTGPPAHLAGCRRCCPRGWAR